MAHSWTDAAQPLTMHSFDPCITCAVHIADPETGESIEIKVT